MPRIGGHGLDRHRQQQPDGIAGGQAGRGQAAGDPVAQPLQVAVGHLAAVPRLRVLAQGDRPGVGLEATVRDVQQRPREPAGALWPVRQVDHVAEGPVEPDRQLADHGRPEARPVPDRPGTEVGLGLEAQPVQEAAEVAPGPDVVRRDPGRGRPLRGSQSRYVSRKRDSWTEAGWCGRRTCRLRYDHRPGASAIADAASSPRSRSRASRCDRPWHVNSSGEIRSKVPMGLPPPPGRCVGDVVGPTEREGDPKARPLIDLRPVHPGLSRMSSGG